MSFNSLLHNLFYPTPIRLFKICSNVMIKPKTKTKTLPQSKRIFFCTRNMLAVISCEYKIPNQRIQVASIVSSIAATKNKKSIINFPKMTLLNSPTDFTVFFLREKKRGSSIMYTAMNKSGFKVI